MPRFRIDRVERNLGCPVFGQNGSHAPLLKVIADNKRRKKSDAASSHRCVPQDLAIVGAQRPWNLNPMVSVGTGELPLVAGREMSVSQASVLAQLFGMLRRAALLEICRTCADDTM